MDGVYATETITSVAKEDLITLYNPVTTVYPGSQTTVYYYGGRDVSTWTTRQ